MVALDLDGTLLTSDKVMCPAAVDHLAGLDDSVLRVVATGRNLSMATRVMDEGSPVDYVVAGSGGIIVRWPSQDVVSRTVLKGARQIAEALVAESTPFLLLRAPPHNHECLVYMGPEDGSVRNIADGLAEMRRRLAAPDHEGAQTPFSFEALDEIERAEGGFGQFLFMGIDDIAAVQHIVEAAAPPNTIRFTRLTSATNAIWLEALPADASKARGLEAVAELHGVDRTRCVAMGNDWNDQDMLDWAGAGCVMGNTPDDFKAHVQRHQPHVDILERSNDEGGVLRGLQQHFPTSTDGVSHSVPEASGS